MFYIEIAGEITVMDSFYKLIQLDVCFMLEPVKFNHLVNDHGNNKCEVYIHTLYKQ